MKRYKSGLFRKRVKRRSSQTNVQRLFKSGSGLLKSFWNNERLKDASAQRKIDKRLPKKYRAVHKKIVKSVAVKKSIPRSELKDLYGEGYITKSAYMAALRKLRR